MTPDAIKEALKQVKYPGFSRDIVSFGLVKTAAFADGTAKVALSLTTADPKIPLHLKTEVENCLRALPGVTATHHTTIAGPPLKFDTPPAKLGGGISPPIGRCVMMPALK